MTRRVAIIGAAHRFPGTTPEQFWQDLLAEKHLISQVSAERWSHESYQHPNKLHPGTSITFSAGSLGDISGFDAAFFGISPREATHMDPQQRLLLELAWEAMEDAGIPPSRLRGSQCGIFIGIASQEYAHRTADDMGVLDASSATGNASSIASNRISYVFDLHGPSMSLDTACSSSLVAFHQACQAIRSGETDTALAGGISLHLHPYGFIVFTKANMLSPKGRCQVFDEGGDGYVRSEGAGLFLLKDHDKAIADGDRVLAVVAGSAVNTDGHKTGLTVPNANAQINLLRHVYQQAGIHPEDIDYLETHGTGTAVGDPIETRAIAVALAMHRDRPLPIGSVKSNLGHLETASGAAGLAKALYSIRERKVPATIGIQRLNPKIPANEWNLNIVTRLYPLKPQGRLVIGINSFGFGGANAHVILESPPAVPTQEVPTQKVPTQKVPTQNAVLQDVDSDRPATDIPLRLSGRGQSALKAQAGKLAEWLSHSDDDLYDIAYSLYHHREHLRDGALLIARNKADAARALKLFANSADDEVPASLTLGRRHDAALGPAFIYSGNGCQWHTMGRDLLESSRTFASMVDQVDSLFQHYADFSLRAEIEGKNGEDRIDRTEVAQPTLFTVQVGITAMLREQGIEPCAVAGHSVGEVAAAWACGALDLADAVKVIYYRSHCQAQTFGQGGMTAVPLGASEMEAWLSRPGYRNVHLAGINSSRGVTVSGSANGLARLETELKKQGIGAKRLPLHYAFHSPAMNPIEADIRASLADMRTHPALVPYFSTVIGGELNGDLMDAEYWWQNIRRPVLFEPAIKTMLGEGINAFIEIGSHPILRRYIHDSMRDMDIEGCVLSTLKREQPAAPCMRRVISQVLLSGARINASHWFPVPGQRVDLPTYPWQRQRYWIESTSDGLGLLDRHHEHPLLGYRLTHDVHGWESQLDTLRLPWLADHVVGDATVFPGAGFVELAIAAALRVSGPGVVEIEDLEITAPLVLDGPHGRKIRVHLHADKRLTICSREPASRSDWQPHSVARVLEQSRGSLLRRSAPRLPTRAPDLNQEQLLAMAADIGLVYGPAFQAITRCWIEDDTVIGEIQLNDAIAGALETLHLHPGILDSAFQLFLPLLAREALENPGLAYVPVRIGRLQFLADGGPPELAQAHLTRRSPHSFCAEFTLYDSQGRALAVLSETRFKAVRLMRQASQRLNYLDVHLTPAPRNADTSALDLSPLTAAATSWRQVFQSATQGRFSAEVTPLLDSLVSAFAYQALHGLTKGACLSRAQHMEIQRAAPKSQALLEQLLDLLRHSGYLEEDDRGWHLKGDPHGVNATTIWQLLVRDYPEYFALIQRVGRFGLHLPAMLEGLNDVAAAGLDSEALASLNHSLISEAGWQALATAFHSILGEMLANVPRGQRLNLLEAGVRAPYFGQRLADLFDADHFDYRAITLSEAARQQAEQLRKRYPLITIDTLANPSSPLPPAHIALISPNIFCHDQTRDLLDSLPACLAPGAHVIVFGVAGSSWCDILQASLAPGRPGHAGDVSEPAAITAALQANGAMDIHEIFLEEDNHGAYLIHARMPDTCTAEKTGAGAEKIPQTSLVAPEHAFQLIIDPASRPLGKQLQAKLRQHGADASLATGWRPAECPTIFVDLRQQPERCAQVAQWPQALETCNQPAELWLITRGVAAMWEKEHREEHTEEGWEQEQNLCTEPSADTTLWGFGRSLANEAVGYRVRLLDLPVVQYPDDKLIEAFVDELMAPDAETEIILDAQGQRFVTRLHCVSKPDLSTQSGEPRCATTLGFPLPGQLQNLSWRKQPLRSLQPGEVEVDVQATGLNFRDVMYALGLLSDEAIENGFAGATLGLEFSGIVTAVAPDVTDISAGDSVVGFGPASFSNRLLAQRNALALMPEGMSFDSAATIPTAFFTVYYSLKHLARLAPGERVLIHGAAGGVGIAAIQVARWLGAEIYVTVGSDEKRDYLRLMGVERQYDSRSLTFAEEILDDTGGQGVDVVLNSLAGEAINQNLRALRPFGRFLELGKRDFYENTCVGLRPFRNNLSYFGIDSDQLMKEQPELTQALFTDIMALFADGTLTPLPYTAFHADQVISAFRYMQQARQIGKVVVTQRQPPTTTSCQESQAETPLELPSDATYLVTGGLGGFGLQTAKWLVSRGARHLILIGRSGIASAEALAGVSAFYDQGVQVEAAACDITDYDALALLLSSCRERMPPLKGIVHAAAVIDDGLVRHLDGERIHRVLAPKVDGARHLALLTQDDTLDFFVVYSSATTLFGNPGQASYVAANHWLEAFAANRRARGLPATCLRWGVIQDVGILARNPKTRDALQERLGGSALSSCEALNVLGHVLQQNITHRGGPSLGVMELDWRVLRRFLPTSAVPRFRELACMAEDEERADEHDENQLARLLELPDDELHEAVVTLLRSELASILLMEADKLDASRSVYEMGFDSLMGIELMTAIEARLEIKVPVMTISEASTLNKLATFLIRKLRQRVDESHLEGERVTGLALHQAPVNS